MPIITVYAPAHRKPQMKVYINQQLPSHSLLSLSSCGRLCLNSVSLNAPVAPVCLFDWQGLLPLQLFARVPLASQHLSLGLSVHQTLYHANFHCLFLPVQKLGHNYILWGTALEVYLLFVTWVMISHSKC